MNRQTVLDSAICCESDFPESGEDAPYGECLAQYPTHRPAQRALSRSREPSSVRDAILLVHLQFAYAELIKQNRKLMRRLEQLEANPRPLLMPINTFAPFSFEPTRQILVSVEPFLDDSGGLCEYVATFADGVVSISGDTIEEALLFLREQMVSQYEFLDSLPDNRLGRIPRQQLAALKDVMKRTA